jgi:putative transposase
MEKDKSLIFIHELRIKTNPQQLCILNRRLNMSRQIYNACLGEALKRLKLMRESKLYQQAYKMPKEIEKSKGKKVKNKDRNASFNEARKVYKFQEYDLHAFVKTLRSESFLEKHIDSSTAQKLATRAFDAVMKYAVGKRGKPRFKSSNRFSSVEGKSNTTGIRWKGGKIVWGKGLSCSVIYDLKDKHGLEHYALSKETKYVRLVKRRIKGQEAWYAQLIQEGLSYQKGKNKLGSSVVGLDIGPSNIAYVGEDKAGLQAFCPEIDDMSKNIKVLQRKMSRMLRLNNPDNFEADRVIINSNGKEKIKQGKVKKSVKQWTMSQRYILLRNKLSEMQRKMAAQRKTSHGQLVNKILAIGTEIKTENLSYKGFQKNFGKSIGKRAPGLFIELLRRKAEKAGGEVIEFNTRTTALSQTCQCGVKQKKTLKERWHQCNECGINAQRDLYSAFLARFVRENQLDSSQALNAWPGADILLEQALSNLKQTTISKAYLASFGLSQRQSCSSAKKGSVINEALDVVATA